MASRRRPDLVVLDIMLPDMDGFEVIHAAARGAQVVRDRTPG